MGLFGDIGKTVGNILGGPKASAPNIMGQIPRFEKPKEAFERFQKSFDPIQARATGDITGLSQAGTVGTDLLESQKQRALQEATKQGKQITEEQKASALATGGLSAGQLERLGRQGAERDITARQQQLGLFDDRSQQLLATDLAQQQADKLGAQSEIAGLEGSLLDRELDIGRINAGIAQKEFGAQMQANALAQAQNRRRGAGIGSLLGTGVGAAFGGPTGAVIGGSLGGQVGGGLFG